MNLFTPLQNAKQKPISNPLAQAFLNQEREQFLTSRKNQKTEKQTDAFSQALANTGGGALKDQSFLEALASSNKQKLEEENKKRLKKQLHDRINPVNQIEVFSRREKEVIKEIESVKEELKLLAIEIEKTHKEVSITLLTRTVNPGDQGKYYKNFFDRLRQFIVMLKQKIRSAKTWATQMQVKTKKKRSKTGVVMSYFAENETEAIQTAFIHHERSKSRSGG